VTSAVALLGGDPVELDRQVAGGPRNSGVVGYGTGRLRPLGADLEQQVTVAPRGIGYVAGELRHRDQPLRPGSGQPEPPVEQGRPDRHRHRGGAGRVYRAGPVVDPPKQLSRILVPHNRPAEAG
jgi:hypothetical protein